MKKFFLSLAVIVAFAGYALRQQFGGDDEGNVTPPTNDTNSSATTPISSSDTSDTSGMGGMMGSQQTMMGQYRDGSYTGDVADAYYGYIQVKVTITQGKIADVQFLRYPNDRRTSVAINTQAMPYLRSEAIQAQDANVNIVTGATDSSLAFRQSLAAALAQAS